MNDDLLPLLESIIDWCNDAVSAFLGYIDEWLTEE